jgi:hypothetical protein
MKTKALKTPSGRGRRDDWNQLVGRTGSSDATHATSRQGNRTRPHPTIAGDGNKTRRLCDRATGYGSWA